MSKVKLSVIIPVYKVEKYLEQCVDSVLKQDYSNLEVILVDDGSPDRCPDICDLYSQKYQCVRVIHKQNGGLSSARNCGMQEATGKYIMFLDSDDWWNEHIKLEDLIENIERAQDVQMSCFCALNYIPNYGVVIRNDASFYEQEKGILEREEYYKKVVELGNLQEQAGTKILDRKFLLDNQLFFQEGILGEDTEWMFRVLRKVKKILVMDKPFLMYRYGREGSITNSVSVKNVTDLLLVISQSVDYYKDKDNDSLKKYELSHCAYLWFIALSMFSQLSTKDKKNCVLSIKKYAYLSEYAVSRKVKICRIALKILGTNGTAMLLNTYVQLGRKNIIKKGKKIKNAK